MRKIDVFGLTRNKFNPTPAPTPSIFLEVDDKPIDSPTSYYLKRGMYLGVTFRMQKEARKLDDAIDAYAACTDDKIASAEAQISDVQCALQKSIQERSILKARIIEYELLYPEIKATLDFKI